MDAKKDYKGKVVKETVSPVRRVSPYEHCMTAEPVNTDGISVSTGMTYHVDVTPDAQQSFTTSVDVSS